MTNLNKVDQKDQALGPGYTTVQVANPFFGVAGAGQFAGQATVARGQMLRPFPQFGLGTNGTASGNSVFGQIMNQANNMRMVQATVRFQF